MLNIDRRFFVPNPLPQEEIDPPVSESIATHHVHEASAPNGELFVLIPAWHNGEPYYSEFADRMAARGKTVIKFLFANDILTGDPERILLNHRKAGEYVVNKVTELQRAGNFKSTHLSSASLGNVTGLWVLENGLNVDRITTVTASETLADSIAEGIRTQHLWEHMQSNDWSIFGLRRYLGELAPANNVGRTNGIDVTDVLSPQDEVVPFRYGLELRKAFKDADAIVHKRTFPLLEHYLTIGMYYKFARP